MGDGAGVIGMRVSPGCVFPRTYIPSLQVIVMRVSPGILFSHRHRYSSRYQCRS